MDKVSIDGKIESILSIPDLDISSVAVARRIFQAYQEQNIIEAGTFSDNTWYLCDEYKKFTFEFDLDEAEFQAYAVYLHMELNEFLNCLKTYILFRMGELALSALQELICSVKKVICCPIKRLAKIYEYESIRNAGHLLEFFSLLPADGRERELTDLGNMLQIVDDVTKMSSHGGQRKLASFDTYFRFGDIIKRFWIETTDEKEKLFFFPIYMWWNISTILPLRPREFVLTPKDCLHFQNNEWKLTIRRNKLKGSHKTVSYRIQQDYEMQQYTIPEALAKDIEWYQTRISDCAPNDIDTLFTPDIHYVKWERSRPSNSRYFTYINLSTCLRYFYLEVIQNRYGYHVLFEKECTVLPEGEIQYMNLGDTRHLALINLMAEGATPMIAMMLAGHDNPHMSAHYFSNITNWIECATYRQYKRLTKGRTEYAISPSIPKLEVSKFVPLENGGRCYSPRFSLGDYTDCTKICGPAGEIGYCPECTYYRAEGHGFTDSAELYRNRIVVECENLYQIISKVRKNKGEPEDIMQVLLHLQTSTYSYQQYLKEKLLRGEECAETKEDRH